MRQASLVALLTLTLLPRAAAAVTRDTFLVNRTAELIELCTVPESDPMHAPCVAFCHGYLVGAYQYNEAAGHPVKICLPEPRPSRHEGIQMFIAWAKENPQHMNDRPVDTLMRFLATKFGCAKETKP